MRQRQRTVFDLPKFLSLYFQRINLCYRIKEMKIIVLSLFSIIQNITCLQNAFRIQPFICYRNRCRGYFDPFLFYFITVTGPTGRGSL